jgi:hypothetical protein
MKKKKRIDHSPAEAGVAGPGGAEAVSGEGDRLHPRASVALAGGDRSDAARAESVVADGGE